MHSRILRSCSIFGLLVAAYFSTVGCAPPPVWKLHDALEDKYVSRYTLRGYQSGQFRILRDSAWLDDATIIPPGEDVEITNYSEVRIDLNVNNVKCQMYPAVAPTFPINDEGITAFIDKHFATSKEDLQLDDLEVQTRRSIEGGTAALGMSKEEVLLAVGYPCHIDGETPTAGMDRDRILQSNSWKYRNNVIMGAWTFWSVYEFDQDNKLIQVIR